MEGGYENMDHYTVNFKKECRALRAVDFIGGTSLTMHSMLSA